MIITKQMILSDLSNLILPSMFLDVIKTYHFPTFDLRIQHLIQNIENKNFNNIDLSKYPISYKNLQTKPNSIYSRIYKFFDQININNRYNSILLGITIGI